jgi:hypothetical protein
LIQETAKRLGTMAAVAQHLELPCFDPLALIERALHHFQSEAASHQDPYFLERCWIRAYEDLLAYSGRYVRFVFPTDNLIHLPRHSLQDSTDN